MKKNVKDTNKKKEPGKVMKWCNDHIVQILMGVLMAGSGAAGLIIGKDYFYNKGYTNGLNEFRANHVNTARMIINDAGEEAAFTALNLVRSDVNMYKTLLDDPDTVLKKVGEIYGDSDYVKVMKKALET